MVRGGALHSRPPGRLPKRPRPQVHEKELVPRRKGFCIQASISAGLPSAIGIPMAMQCIDFLILEMNRTLNTSHMGQAELSVRNMWSGLSLWSSAVSRIALMGSKYTSHSIHGAFGNFSST